MSDDFDTSDQVQIERDRWEEEQRQLAEINQQEEEALEIDPKSRDGRNYRVPLHRPDGSVLIVMIPIEDDYPNLGDPEGYYLNFVTRDHYT